MSDLHPYLADDELSTALAEHHAERTAWSESVVAWDDAHPHHKLLFRKSGFTMDRTAIGFTDGQPGEPPPAGLSRAKTRVELIPSTRLKAGRPWQHALDEINESCPRIEPIFSRFGVPSSMWVGNGIAATQYADAGEHGWLVVNLHDLSGGGGQFHRPTGDPQAHLTPIPLSEFYRIKESLEAEKAEAKS